MELDSEIHEFFEIFLPTIELLEELANSRKYPQEIILLSCARLDALASIAYPNMPSRERFVKFVLNYAGYKVLDKVSVGNLYWDTLYRSESMAANIAKPGRLIQFTEDDEFFIDFLKDSDLSLTEEDVGQVMSHISTILRQHFRVIPGQSRSKREGADINDVVKYILQGFETPRRKHILEEIEPAKKQLKRYIGEMKLARILYREYRCEVIHQGSVGIIDERFFFRRELPYWTSWYSDLFESKFLTVEFPATFLIRLLRNTIETYRCHLREKCVLPVDLYRWLYSDIDEFIEHSDQLDESTLPEPHRLRYARTRQ